MRSRELNEHDLDHRSAPVWSSNEFRSAIEAAVALGTGRCIRPGASLIATFLSCFSLSRLRWSMGTGECKGSVIGRDGRRSPIRPLGPHPRLTVLPPRGYLWRVGNKNKYEISLPDRQRTLSDGNYVYGWYSQIRLDTPISEIYTGCWATNQIRRIRNSANIVLV